MQPDSPNERADRVLHWLGLIYSGDVSGSMNAANPRVALRIRAESPDLAAGDPYLSCAIGDENALRLATQADPSWLNRPGGPLRLPPLFAVVHSALLRVAEFRERLHESAKFLIAAGADVNQRIYSRWPPGSLSNPDERCPLSTLYGAAGTNRDAALTKLLLEAGADPNDGESLYHSLENPDCTPPLAGAWRSHRRDERDLQIARPRRCGAAQAATAAWRRSKRASAKSAAE